MGDPVFILVTVLSFILKLAGMPGGGSSGAWCPLGGMGCTTSGGPDRGSKGTFSCVALSSSCKSSLVHFNMW